MIQPSKVLKLKIENWILAIKKREIHQQRIFKMVNKYSRYNKRNNLQQNISNFII